MNKELYEKFKKLGEEEYPIVQVEDTFLTPSYMFKEDIPEEIINTIDPNWELLTARIIKRYNEGKIKERYTTNGLVTPDDVYDNVINRTDDGYRYLLQEHNYIRYILEESFKYDF